MHKTDKEKGTVSFHVDADDLLLNVPSYDCMTLLESYGILEEAR